MASHNLTISFKSNFCYDSMRPEKVFSWRAQLPPPFDQFRPKVKRRGSAARLEEPIDTDNGPGSIRKNTCRERANSAPGAVDQADRRMGWLRFIDAQHTIVRKVRSDAAVEKLKR